MRLPIVFPTRVAPIESCGHTHRNVAASWRYRPEAPLVVELVIRDTSGPVVWRFARELLVDGLIELSGIGDVRIQPGHDGLTTIALTGSDDGRNREYSTTLLTPNVHIRAFLALTHAAIPAGHEAIDVDGAIAAILGGVK